MAFSKSGSTFTSLNGDGATLVDTGSAYVLTLSNGAVYTYGNRSWATSDGTTVKARITQIDLPNRTRINMAYREVTYCTNNLDGCSGGTWRTKIRLQGVTNSHGYQLHYNYQANNSATSQQGTNWDKLVSVRALNMAVDACDPAATTCTYSQAWPLTSFSTGVSGNDTIYTVSDPLGRGMRYAYGSDASGVYFKVRRPSSAADNLTVRVDAAGRVTQVNRDGLTWYYGFSLAGSSMTATRTNPNGSTRTVVSSTAVGLPTSVTDENGKTTAYTYDASGRLTRITLPEGNYVQYTYDARGNVIEERQVSKTPGTPPDIVVSANYAASCANTLTCNKPNWTIDPRGAQTDYVWDGTHGGLVSATAPADLSGVRPQVRHAYAGLQAYFRNPAGSIVASGVTQYLPVATSSCAVAVVGNPASCVGTSQERKATVDYGPQTPGIANNLLPVATTIAAGDGSLSATSSFTYDGVGNQTKVDGPLPGAADTAIVRYDAARQVVGTVSPDPDGAGPRTPVATRTTYNLDGQVTQQEVGTVPDQTDTGWAAFSSAQQEVVTYDAAARPVRTEAKAGGTSYAVTAQTYDAAGRPDCTVVRMDPAQWAGQTDACAPQTGGPNGPDRVVRPTYDIASRVVATTTAYGTAAASTESTTFTNNGLVQTVKDAENNLTTYEYDGHDRPVKTRYPVALKGAATSSTTDFDGAAYDPAGNVTTRSQRDGGTIAFTYDNLNRTASRTPQGEAAVTYSYNLLGQQTQIQRPADGATLTYGYDGLGRLVTEAQPTGTMAYQYDLAGRTTRLTWADGLYAGYDYDVLGNVTAIRENGATSGLGVLASFGYDALGRRSLVTRGNGTVMGYSYDSIGRLSCLTDNLAGGATPGCTPAATGSDRAATFAWNPAGQIAALSQANDIYAWTGSVNVDRSYAGNGLNQYTAAGATGFQYDGRGNLTVSGSTVYSYNRLNQLVSAQPPGGYLTQLTYDPAGRLNRIADPTGAVLHLYAGTMRVAEFGGDANMLRRYVPGPSPDETVVWYEGGGTADRRWLHSDERGSVVAVSDGSGSTIAINRYDEYGIPQAGNLGKFQYTGQAWVPELGMYYYKARFYSPTLGRFLQTDPIGYGDGLNWYNYVGGDPVNGTDPSGLAYMGCTGSRVCGTVRYDKSGGVIPYQYGSGAGQFGSLATADFSGIGQRMVMSTSTRTRPGSSGWDGSGIVVTATVTFTSYSFAGASVVFAGARAASGAGTPQTLQSSPCNRFQQQLQEVGNLGVDVGGAVVAGGAVVTGGSTALAVGGAFTGNVPAAGVGTVGIGLGGTITAVGGLIQGGSALVAFAGGASSRQLVKDGSDSIINRLPLPGLVKTGVKKAVDKASEFVRDLRVCR